MSNLKPNIDPTLYKIDNSTIEKPRSAFWEHNQSQTDISLDQIKTEFDNFSRIDIDNLLHRNELLEMHPDWLLSQTSSRNLKRFLSMSRYDDKNSTFVAGCFENTPEYCHLVSYKRRRLSIGKWITRKDTHPNASVFINIYPDGNPIYFIEGVHDAGVAVLLGVNFIMLPYAGYKNTNPTAIQLEVKNRDVVFLVEDKAAYGCMSILASSLQLTAKSIVLKRLGKKNEKMDLGDYVQNFETIEEVINALQNN